MRTQRIRIRDYATGRCQALDNNLERCRRRATHIGCYHGAEFYQTYDDSRVTAIAVMLCRQHAEATIAETVEVTELP